MMPSSRASVAGIGLLVSAVFATPVLAAPFTVTDASFSGGVYDFQFIPGSGPSPFLTNSGWAIDSVFAVDYFQGGGSDSTGTIGWDFNGQSSTLSTIEVAVAMVLFDFGSFADNAFEDAIFFEVAALPPGAAFGTGSFVEVARRTGDNDNTTLEAILGLIDLVPFLPASWLSNPGNLELRASFDELPFDAAHPLNPGSHVQFGRNDDGNANVNGIQLVATAGGPRADPNDPILPTGGGGGGPFLFDAVIGFGRWFDPPLVGGYEYATDGSSNFTEVGLPPLANVPDADGEYLVSSVNGDQIVLAGDYYVFPSPVDFFTVTEINPLVDGGDALAFPTFLAFDQETVSFSMTPIPEPSTLALAGLGLLSLGFYAWPRRKSA